MTSGTNPSVSSCVHQERRGRVLVIRMEREAKRNAVDQSMTRGIDEALNLLEDDDQLWAGVITGTTAVFSAGTDLRDGTGGPTCASSPVSVSASLTALAAQHDAADAAGWEVTARAVERVKASDDSREGVTAFFEKRPPRWTGH